MGWPSHPLASLPTPDPAILDAIRTAALDPQGVRPAFMTTARGATKRHAEPGHVCVTCWVVTPDGTRLLLVHHRVLGWSVPGGHVEAGESPWAAARRELEEETGLSIGTHPDVDPAPTLVHVGGYPDTDRGPAHRHWFLGYLVRSDASAALSDGQWFAVDALPDDALDDLRSLVPPLLTVTPAAAATVRR